MADVRCTVSDCNYWDEGNRCGADVIWITLDRLAGDYDMEISQLEEVQTVAKRSAATCCDTYKPRQD